MADDTRDKDPSTVTPVVSSPAGAPPTKLPKGMVLGKDGKPCRSCTSKGAFADWAAQTKKTTKASTVGRHLPPDDCPPDVDDIGRSSWTLLHSITANYPVTPTFTEQSQAKQFMGLFSKLYPCWVCAEDFQEFIVKNKVRTESREEFGQWMCEAHNDVNRKLGKKEFDCSKWEERWRTGWKDGRCD